MLADQDASATVAVTDLERARAFYGETLGLSQVDAGGDGVLVFRSGRSTMVVYRSEFAGTNQATTVTWGVGDELEAIVGALESKGVTFERYDLPHAEHRGPIHVFGDFRAAWFKDPDGNILHLNSD